MNKPKINEKTMQGKQLEHDNEYRTLHSCHTWPLYWFHQHVLSMSTMLPMLLFREGCVRSSLFGLVQLISILG